MPGPQRQLLNEDKICRKVKKKIGFEEEKTMKKIRVLCSDPDATDSSSEDEDFKEIKVKRRNGVEGSKRLILEFHVPVFSSDAKDSFQEIDSENLNDNKNPSRFSSDAQNNEELSKPLAGEATTDSYCVSEDSGTGFSTSSPSSVLDASGSTSMAEGSLNSSTDETRIAEPVTDLFEEPFLDLESLFVGDFGLVFHDFVGFDSFPLGREERSISCFDLDLECDVVGWMNL